MVEVKDNSIEFYQGSNTTTVTFSTKKYINKILALSKTHPDEVEIIKMPDENDGYLYAHIPTRWVKIGAPKKVSDEQRQAMAERAKTARLAKNS